MKGFFDFYSKLPNDEITIRYYYAKWKDACAYFLSLDSLLVKGDHYLNIVRI